MELIPNHLQTLERLVAAGFAPMPPATYPNAMGIRRGPFAAMLRPTPAGGLEMQGEPYYLIEGNLAVAVVREGKKHYVWKKRSVPATAETEAELKTFRTDLLAALS
jgi:hypothetical protein